jgi:hypothetical protein
MIIVALTNSSCAFGMGRTRCDSPDPLPIPTRPEDEYCVSDEHGAGFCSNGKMESMKNYICRKPEVDSRNEQWIKDILKAINP